MTNFERYNSVQEIILKRAAEAFPKMVHLNYKNDFEVLTGDLKDCGEFVHATLVSMAKVGKVDIVSDKADDGFSVVLTEDQYANLSH